MSLARLFPLALLLIAPLLHAENCVVFLLDSAQSAKEAAELDSRIAVLQAEQNLLNDPNVYLDESQLAPLRDRGLTELDRHELKHFRVNAIVKELFDLETKKWTIYANALLTKTVPGSMPPDQARQELVRVQRFLNWALTPEQAQGVLSSWVARNGGGSSADSPRLLAEAGFSDQEALGIKMPSSGASVFPPRTKCCASGCFNCPWNFPLTRLNQNRKQ